MKKNTLDITRKQQVKALLLSTISFTMCFAVWTIFSIIGIKIKSQLQLSDTQFGLLIATPILTGSLSRLILGIWSNQYGGRIVYTLLMLSAAISTWCLTLVNTYYEYLFVALGVGLAGGSFSVGIYYVSTWYETKEQGTALGIFGMGNFGAAITNLLAPFLLVLMGWHGVVKTYSIVLFSTAIIFYILSEDDPNLRERKILGHKADNILKQMEPLKNLQVWRFALYYFFVFGCFVALALWLPRYYMGAYGLTIKQAGMLTTMYSLPGSIFRAMGGCMSDKWGARTVMYFTFVFSMICLFFLSYPKTDYIVQGISKNVHFSLNINIYIFVCLTIILGFFMSLGKAAVYKHIPVYYPSNVGSVGGIVGLIGGLGGFILPIVFGFMNDHLNVWTSCFMVLFVITLVSLLWMHFSIINIEKEKYMELIINKKLPNLEIK